jgi:hypothetical protein
MMLGQFDVMTYGYNEGNDAHVATFFIRGFLFASE